MRIDHSCSIPRRHVGPDIAQIAQIAAFWRCTQCGEWWRVYYYSAFSSKAVRLNIPSFKKWKWKRGLHK
jgi:hypothetical protein